MRTREHIPLTPGPNARIMPGRFENWLTRSTLQT
ncbi:hypothetical protein SAMN05443639_106334 [Stigmatella erecta]|uniref:Uncharacterized protein n=1 Tax=Stigmatella erecta TaxID=83460 RepID=A0A1I0IWB5_9BACT|nr:hypothetical protein SAMN05443639_106334 [Stigmatella erecta]